MAGIMIGLWDLTTAANNCQESMNVIYSASDVEGGERCRCGRNVWCEVRVVQQFMWLLYMVSRQAGLRGGFRGRTQRMMVLPQLVMLGNHRSHYIHYYHRAQSTSHPVI